MVIASQLTLLDLAPLASTSGRGARLVVVGVDLLTVTDGISFLVSTGGIGLLVEVLAAWRVVPVGGASRLFNCLQ